MKEYFPKTHSENRMKDEGNTVAARNMFFQTKNKILYNLVKNRFEWMNDYIYPADEKIIELGCGMGLSKLFIKSKNLKLTDVIKNEWVDEICDAMDMQYEDNSLDVIICSHMIHHIANPATFFDHAQKKLKSGGRIVIQDIYTGSLMKLALRIMRHEGFSDKVNVFDRSVICNQPDDPWSANCSIPKLLFKKKTWGGYLFEENFSGMKIIKRELCECFMFFFSGGVIAKTFYLPLNNFGVKLLKGLDRFLIKILPGVFAAGCSVVIQKE